MSRYSVSASTLAELDKALLSILSESNSSSLSEQHDQLIDIRKRYDELHAVVDKLVSKAQAGEADPTKRMYGPEMTAKVKKLGADATQFSQTLEETEIQFKPKWDEFLQAKEKAESEKKAQAKKEEKERLEREEKKRLEKEKLEREEKERIEKEEAERKIKEQEEKIRLEKEAKEKEERLRAEQKLAEEKKKAEEEEKRRQEERKREEEQQSKARQLDNRDAELIKLSIKTAKGATLSLEAFPKSGTVKELKESIEKHHSISQASQRLIFQGRLLADAKKITDYKIADRCVVHLVENARAASAAKARSSATGAEPKWMVPPGTVHELTGGKTEFDSIAENCGSKRLLVVDWSASWCGPCKMIAPVFARLAERFSNVTFVKVDTEKTPANQQFTMEKQIRGYPTFQYYVGNAIVHQFSGANGAKMENGIRRGLAIVSSKAQGSGSSAGTSGVDTRPLTERVLSALTNLKNNCPSAEFVVAVKTLLTFVKNVVDHPTEEKYRRVRTSNNAFQARLASKTGGVECMHAFGFENMQENGENFLVLSAAAASNPDLPRVKQQLEQALAAISGTSAGSSAQQAGRAPATDSMGGMGGLGGMPGFPGMGGAMPDMGGGMGGFPNIDPATFGELMNDPSFMQLATEMGTDSSLQAAMLEAQQAMQSGDMAAMQRVMMNPAMARIGQAMANSPAMMNVMRRQFANGMPPGMFGNQNNQNTGMGNMAPNANGQTQQQTANGTATGGMPAAPPNIPGAPTTPEEEDRLLQEAIRLSMQDQTRSSGSDAPKKEGDQGDKQS